MLDVRGNPKPYIHPKSQAQLVMPGKRSILTLVVFVFYIFSKLFGSCAQRKEK